MAVLSDNAIAAYAKAAGFSGTGLTMALAIALAESGGNPQATGANPGSIDRGLWQINSVYHREVSDACAYSPSCCAQAAYAISRGGTNWTPWTTYTTGAYRQYMARSQVAAAAVSSNSAPGPANGPQAPTSAGSTSTLADIVQQATTPGATTTISYGSSSEQVGTAYALLLAIGLMLLILWLISRTRVGYAAVYYGEVLILVFLVVTQAQWFREALNPLTANAKPVTQ